MSLRKKFNPQDATPEQIQKDIELAMHDESIEDLDSNHVSKIFTLIMLFVTYIFFAVYITDYSKRIIFITFGLIVLIVLLQLYIIHPAIKRNNMRRLG